VSLPLTARQNRKFIAEYVGSGKKCKLCVGLRETGVFYSEPLEIKSRAETEVKAIEAWHVKFKNFLSDTSRALENDPQSGGQKQWAKVPTVKDYEDFEKQLSASTLRNYIRFRLLLASIPNNNDTTAPTLTPDASFRKFGDYLDTLHPLERGVLINDALRYFNGTPGNNDQKMRYLLLPQMPKLEREKWITTIKRMEDHKTLLELPEPQPTKE